MVNSRFNSAARKRGFHGRDLRLGLGGRRKPAVVLFGGDRVLGRQPAGALAFGGGARERGLPARQVRAQPIHFGLERARIDLEQDVAALDDGPFGELHGRNQPGHARAHVDVVHGFEPAGELVPFGDVAGQGPGGGDRGRRRRRDLRGRLRAPGKSEGQKNGKGC